MRQAFLVAIVGGLALGSAVALADPVALKALDADSDGTIDLAEAQAGAELLKMIC